MSSFTTEQVKLIDALKSRSLTKTEYSPKELLIISGKLKIANGEVYRFLKKIPNPRRGVYSVKDLFEDNTITEVATTKKQKAQPTAAAANVVAIKKESPKVMIKSTVTRDDVFIPEQNPTYVPWGAFKDVLKIIKSQVFFPVYVMGFSGNGKTVMIEQACAKAMREYVRVQITSETDEDDLIGGFRLVNGETVYYKGPVIRAMESGAILFIDEIDKATSKIMCLQGILEGKPIMIKKTGEIITPAPGFNIFAAANTKGKGSENSQYVYSTIIDESFLERFAITIEQPFAPVATERSILANHFDSYNISDYGTFAERLVSWADTIRKTYADGGVDEIISTRRLCHIAQTFSIFKNRLKAIELCISRFDEHTKDAFLDLYKKVDDEATAEIEAAIEKDASADAKRDAFSQQLMNSLKYPV